MRLRACGTRCSGITFNDNGTAPRAFSSMPSSLDRCRYLVALRDVGDPRACPFSVHALLCEHAMVERGSAEPAWWRTYAGRTLLCFSGRRTATCGHGTHIHTDSDALPDAYTERTG